MNQQVIITKGADCVIPKAYLETAIAKCDSYWGIAMQDVDAGGTPKLDVSGAVEKANIDTFVNLMEECKDARMIIVLGKMTQDFDALSDLQPFTFMQKTGDNDEDLENALAVAFEGSFPNYVKPGKGHTEEYNLWEGFVYPTLMDKFEGSDSLDTFYDKVKSSAFEQGIMNTVDHRGVAVFLGVTGDVIAFGRNDLGGSFDDGKWTTSNTFGWGAPSVTQKVTQTVGKARGRLAALVGGSAVTVLPKDDKAPAKPEGVHETTSTAKPVNGDKKTSVPKTDTAVKENKSAPEGFTKMAPPSKLQGNAKNAWIRLFAGLDNKADLPAGHNFSNFAMDIPNNLVQFAMRDVSTKDDVRKLHDAVRKFQTDGTVTPAEPPKEDGKKDVHEVATETNKNKDKIVAGGDSSPADYIPVLSAADKEGAGNLVLEFATRDPKGRPGPLELQRIEAKFDKFTDIFGIKPEDMLSWTMHDIKILGKKHPDALAMAFSQMRRQFIEGSGIDLKALVNTEVKTKPTAAPPSKSGAPASKVPDPAPTKPAESGVKKSRLAALTGKAA